MRELQVVGVRVEVPNNQPIVLLREDDGDRYLPIWIGAAEATAIAYAQQGVTPPRPLTHDLFASVLSALGRRLEEVRITELRDGVFFAELVFDGGLEVGARSSDAIALALRTGARIVGADEVLEEAGILVPDEDEDEVEKFREFLDQISPEDFESPGASGPPAAPGDDPGADPGDEPGEESAGGRGPAAQGPDEGPRGGSPST